MNDFNNRLRQLSAQNTQMDIKTVRIQTFRDSIGSAPPALLSFSNIIAMKPGSKGRHDMRNR